MARVVFTRVFGKNILSIGNGGIEYNLNDHSHTLIVGENGAGKCLDANTKIDIKISNPEVIEKFFHIRSNERIIITQVKIIDIVEFYEQYPEYKGFIKVLSRYGYHTIEEAQMTAQDSIVFEIYLENGYTLRGSPDHRIDCNNQWTFLKDIKFNDIVSTDIGLVKVSNILISEKKEDLYDLQVAKVHEFFANGVVSHNSALLSMICFALFNKPYININKPQLINTINNKELYCEIEFTIGNNNYCVKRGIKPNIFEIWCNGELLNQDAASKDYQSVLENQIIRFNYNSFVQVAIIGSANYKAFMSLTTPQRRLIIEELLDIKIFSDMAEVLKKDKERIKNDLQELETQLTICKSQVKMKNEFIKKYEKDNTDHIVELKNSKNNALEKRKLIQDSITPLQEKNNSMQDDLVSLPEVNKQFTKLSVYKTKLESSNQNYIKKIEEYRNLTNCPTCSQDICDNHRTDLITSYENKIEENNNNLKLLEVKLREIQIDIDNLNLKRKESDDNIRLINEKTNELFGIDASLKQLDIQIEKMQMASSESISEAKNDIKKGAEQVLKLIDTNKKLVEERSIQELATILLKDQGIKASIIKKILPVFNQLINKYLNKLDFFVSFEFNEQFEETIKSRHRDTFSYNSFSQGQKLRIDLAVIFAWRELIKQRSAIDTNLLIMDEILDMSIDTEGIHLLIDILYSDIMTGTNVFLISHRQEWMDKFSNVIMLELKNNFTVVKDR